jgi:hypothetical protein
MKKMPARLRIFALALALTVSATLSTACHQADLSKSLTVAPVLSGYYDAGMLDGWAHLLPDLTFKLKNTGADAVPAGVELSVDFWFKGDTDGENDSVLIGGLKETLQPGQESTTLTARAPHGFRLEGARADMFTNSRFRDMVAKVFVKSHGTIFRLGEFPIDRQIIPHATTAGRP